jgi:hypothetical protein
LASLTISYSTCSNCSCNTVSELQVRSSSQSGISHTHVPAMIRLVQSVGSARDVHSGQSPRAPRLTVGGMVPWGRPRPPCYEFYWAAVVTVLNGFGKKSASCDDRYFFPLVLRNRSLALAPQQASPPGQHKRFLGGKAPMKSTSLGAGQQGGTASSLLKTCL